MLFSRLIIAWAQRYCRRFWILELGNFEIYTDAWTISVLNFPISQSQNFPINRGVYPTVTDIDDCILKKICSEKIYTLNIVFCLLLCSGLLANSTCCHYS